MASDKGVASVHGHMVATCCENPKVQTYIDGVLSGDIVVCKYIRQAVERHEADLQYGAARGLFFDADEAQLAIDFIELLSHSKGEWAGHQIYLEPWQAFVLWCIFGWKKSNGCRRFNTAFLSVARKNGKSTMGAAIGHKLFVADGEPGAEVYTAATKRDQAKIVHEEAKRMVKSSPCLKAVIYVLRDVLSIDATNSKYVPLGADADTLDGLNPSGVIIDEIHAHKTRAVWDVMDTGTGARRNPLLLGITTAGAAGDHESIYWELKEYSIKVVDGTVTDDSWFAAIYTLDADDDWTDESTWIKANPNLGVSVKLDDLQRKAIKAKEAPYSQSNFKRKHLNLETETTTPWIATDPESAWSKCGGGDYYDAKGLTQATIKRFANCPCYVGGDLSSIGDLTALSFAFPQSDASVDVIQFCWCPRNNAIGRQRDNRVPYVTWSGMGLINLTEGDSVDYDDIRHVLRNARDAWKWDIRRIAFDPSNARYLQTKIIEEDGFNQPEQVIDHKQTIEHMNNPIRMVEKLILDGKLRHGGHDVLRWCVSNVILYQDTGGRVRFNKKMSREKIDCAQSMVMAVGQALLNIKPKSIYDSREMFAL